MEDRGRDPPSVDHRCTADAEGSLPPFSPPATPPLPLPSPFSPVLVPSPPVAVLGRMEPPRIWSSGRRSVAGGDTSALGRKQEGRRPW
ncbi:hypothetical protein BRADI_4g34053v3 [Brachypodium distachyon]|uniref:Uncharacterized protein n=1 Tax=Brachypodium distachyon TaxID=15368 RepID=A0A0Q3HRF8_BRADI|nr:hypothetical protein BRADI_4g34053v3 [Brachypodium distachyon]